jgi:thiamine-phosphate pyrophosphorylase
MRRARVPTIWLFTDERLGGAHPDDPLWQALARLPRGAGIVFRHYSLAPAARTALLARVARLARRRDLLLLGSRIQGAPDGVHRPAHAPSGRRTPARLVTASAHSRPQALAAFRAGADLVFLSPVFPTRSHSGGPVLGPLRFGLASRNLPGPVIALGGMTGARFGRLAPLGANGYAGIDCWSRQAPAQPGISSARC